MPGTLNCTSSRALSITVASNLTRDAGLFWYGSFWGEALQGRRTQAQRRMAENPPHPVKEIDPSTGEEMRGLAQ
eukprot:559745-Pelagomonas_calceolata.AAC.2